ncbi:protein of unknown function [Hyphomicrobium sp. MC1]|nr:protein of unknown function [Hyphomicrobium sp. MC1]
MPRVALWLRIAKCYSFPVFGQLVHLATLVRAIGELPITPGQTKFNKFVSARLGRNIAVKLWPTSECPQRINRTARKLLEYLSLAHRGVFLPKIIPRRAGCINLPLVPAPLL